MCKEGWSKSPRGRPAPLSASRLPVGGYGGRVSLHLSQIPEADELLTRDPLALLVGIVLDQHMS